jgi:hypothetical protein
VAEGKSRPVDYTTDFRWHRTRGVIFLSSCAEDGWLMLVTLHSVRFPTQSTSGESNPQTIRRKTALTSISTSPITA